MTTRRDTKILQFVQAGTPKDIIAPSMINNDTWNTCPKCGTYWQSDSVPGLLHRTRTCVNCLDSDRSH